MRRFATRLLTLMIYAAPLMAIPTITPAKAATNDSREVGKSKKAHKSAGPGITDSRPPTPKWPPPIEDDFDRKNGGGGGM
jgi:hypothetical protein